MDFDFSNSMFDLEEPNIPKLDDNFVTPAQVINAKYKNVDHLAKLAHVNACSVPKHIHEIEKLLTETNFDCLGVSETFISKNTPVSLYQIPGYKFINKSRDQKCRGGIGIYVQDNLPFKLIKLPSELVQPEMLFIEVQIGIVKMAIGVIYKSPLIPYSIYAGIHENLCAVTNKY